jgi:hypothetical protein
MSMHPPALAQALSRNGLIGVLRELFTVFDDPTYPRDGLLLSLRERVEMPPLFGPITRSGGFRPPSPTDGMRFL